MKKASSLKSTVAIVVVVAIAFLGYYFYKSGASSSGAGLLSQGSGSTGAIGSQVLGLLNQIQSLRIDASLFADPGYQTLRDYSVAIPPENVGRANPFAPLPGAPAPTKK